MSALGAVTWRPGCGRKATTGDVVQIPGTQRTLQLVKHATTVGKRTTCAGGGLSRRDARKLRRLAEGSVVSGARVLGKRLGLRDCQIPKYPACRTRAVLRWTAKAVGRPLGLRVVVRELKRHGLAS